MKPLLTLVVLASLVTLLFDDRSKRDALDQSQAQIQAQSEEAIKSKAEIDQLTKERDALTQKVAKLTGVAAAPTPGAVAELTPTSTVPPDPNVSAAPVVAATPAVAAAASPADNASAAPTPHPAFAASKAAIALYPALGQKGSTFNLLFLDLMNQRRKDNPASLAQPDWPLELAQETALKLGVQPANAQPVNVRPQLTAQNATPAPQGNPFMQGYVNPLDKGGYDEKKSPHPYWWYWYWR